MKPRVTRLPPARKLVLLATLALGLAGCCFRNEKLWISTPLAGPAAERSRFEGEWYGPEGELQMIVSGDALPSLKLRQPLDGPIDRIENARTEGGELRVAVLQYGDQSPRDVELSVTSAGEARLRYGSPRDTAFKTGSFLCANPFFTFPFSQPLKHNPSPAWFGRIAFRHAGEAVHKTGEAILDRLARVL